MDTNVHSGSMLSTSFATNIHIMHDTYSLPNSQSIFKRI